MSRIVANTAKDVLRRRRRRREVPFFEAEVPGRTPEDLAQEKQMLVLLREVEQRTRILGRLSECFTDHRDSDRIEHSGEALIKQRVLGLCLGYEDLNDYGELCRDRLLALLCDRDDLTREFRRVESD